MMRKPGSETAVGRELPGTWRWVGRWEAGDRAPTKKENSFGYSHHRPRSGKLISDQWVSAIEHRPLYQFFAAALNRTRSHPYEPSSDCS